MWQCNLHIDAHFSNPKSSILCWKWKSNQINYISMCHFFLRIGMYNLKRLEHMFSESAMPEGFKVCSDVNPIMRNGLFLLEIHIFFSNLEVKHEKQSYHCIKCAVPVLICLQIIYPRNLCNIQYHCIICKFNQGYEVLLVLAVWKSAN